jgi:hypothetical protein
MAETMLMAEYAPPPPPSSSSSSKQGQYQPKLVKTGELTITSNNIESTKSLLYKFVKECNGYVTNENLVKDEIFSYYNISLNISAVRFDLFLQLLDSSRMNIVSRTFSVEDVTLKYIDDSTRLLNKKKLEKKYLDLLSRTNDMKSILEIEDKLEEIQTDIEVKEGQMKVLDKQIAYSAFQVKIEQDIVNASYEDRTKFTYMLKQAVVRGWEGVRSAAIGLVSLWPLWVLIYLLFLVIKFFIRRRKNQKR